VSEITRPCDPLSTKLGSGQRGHDIATLVCAICRACIFRIEVGLNKCAFVFFLAGMSTGPHFSLGLSRAKMVRRTVEKSNICVKRTRNNCALVSTSGSSPLSPTYTHPPMQEDARGLTLFDRDVIELLFHLHAKREEVPFFPGPRSVSR